MKNTRGPGGLEINIFMGKIGEINKWPQGLVEKPPILRLNKVSVSFVK